MVNGLRNLVDADLDPVADVILHEETYRALPEALGWLGSLGVRRADLWSVSLTDQNRDNLASMPRMSEVVRVFDAAFDVAVSSASRASSWRLGVSSDWLR